MPKRLPFFKLYVRFTIFKWSYFPIINTSMAISNIAWMKTLLWYVLFSFSKRSVFTFIIIKPKMKLCFSFSNIGSIITNFTSQKVKNLFRVTVKGPLGILNTSLHAFVVKLLVVVIWSHTWQVPFPHGSKPLVMLKVSLLLEFWYSLVQEGYPYIHLLLWLSASYPIFRCSLFPSAICLSCYSVDQTFIIRANHVVP